VFAGLVGFIDRTVGLFPALIGLTSAYATKVAISAVQTKIAAAGSLRLAISNAWANAMKAGGLTGGFGMPVFAAIAAGIIATMIASYAKSPKAQHGAFATAKPGGTMMNIAEAGVDEFVIPEPKLASLMNQDTVVAAVEKVAANVALNTEQRQAQQENLWGFGGTVANQIGGATTSAIQASTGL
jgi:hypothetical protein